MAKQVDTIKKFVDTLTKTTKTGTAAVDEAMGSVGAGNYSTFKQKFLEAQTGRGTQDFLEQICGVRIYNTDTGAITGSDAGGSVTKTADSIVPEATAAKEPTEAEYSRFTKNGLTVNILYNASNDSERNKQRLIARALYNWWIPESLDLINESLGINFTDGRANINEITVDIGNYGWGYAHERSYVGIKADYDLGRASNVTLMIGTSVLSGLTGNDKNGVLDRKSGIYSPIYYTKNSYSTAYNGNYSSPYASYADQLILQALAEITLEANVSYFNKLPSEISNGLVELVGGYDSSTSDLSNFLNSSNNYNAQYYGYTLMRYLAKNYAVETLPAGLSYNSDKTVLTASTAFTGTKIDLANFEGTVKTVNASKLTQDVQIIGNALANSIIGGSGADTLAGASGNDSLTGGAGNDVFIYSAGRDVITDYAAGDRISLGAAISKSSVSGSDVVFTIGSGLLTVKNAKGKTLSMIDAAGKAYTTVIGAAAASTLMTVTNSTKTPVTIGAAIKTVDATKRTTAISLTGNKLDNSISGGTGNDSLHGGDGQDSILGGAGNDKIWGDAGNDNLRGGAGNDTIAGGAGNDKIFGDAGNDVLNGGAGNDSLAGGDGNDSLTGGAGNDYFFFSAGKDVITDYATGDKIKISSGKISKATLSGSDVVFTIGTGSLTVKDGKGKTLSMIDSAGKSFSTVVGGSTPATTPSGTYTITNSTKSPVKLGASYKAANASSRTSAIKITGNDSANSIIGGKGNDTLDGGKGNDSLWGNAGKDVFLYSDGEGKDIIYGFANDDMLLITGAFTGTYNKSNKEIAFKVGSTASAITLKDFTATTFNVNGYDYGISGTKLVKK